MFDVKIKGNKASVTRSLTLPKAGPLDALPLSSTFEIALDLGGLDPKSKTHKEICETFGKVYANELNATRKKYDDAFVAIWVDAAKKAKAGADAKALQKIGQDAQNKIVQGWNDFNKKRGAYLADTLLKSVADNVTKKAKMEAAKPKTKFSSNDLKDNRVGILTAILGAVTMGVATSGLGWLAMGIGSVATLAKGYRHAWEIGQKQATDTQTNLNQIGLGLKDASTALTKLGPSLTRLDLSRKQFESQMASAAVEMKSMRKELAALEVRAKKDKAVREGKHLEALRTACDTQMAKIASLQKAVGQISDLRSAIDKADAATKAAESLVQVKVKGWDKFMSSYTSVSKDGQSLASAAGKVVKQFEKLV